MKIALLATADSPHSGRWANFFAERGHQVHWISLVPFDGIFGGPTVPGITRHHLGPTPRGPLGIWRTVGAVKQVLRAVQPDLLHAHYLGLYGMVAALTGFHPFVGTAWGSDVVVAGKSWYKRPILKWILARTDVLTCDANHMKEAMVKLGVPPDKITVIFFGTDTRKFRPGLDRDAFRRRFANGDHPLIVSTRSLEPIYDIPTLLRAAPLVLKDAPETRFMVVGRGSLRESLEAEAKALGLDGKLGFVGAVTGQEMPLCVAAGDIYVSTSLSDGGLAASTAEAMAAELPVVVSDSADNREWVAEGKGGYLFPVSQPATLAERILHLIRHPEERRQFGAFNRKVIQERNDYYVEMEKIERLYERTIRQ